MSKRGFTLIECIISVAVAALFIMGTLSLFSLARMQNEVEQERAKAHQIVCQQLEITNIQGYDWTQSQWTKVIWDNGTPDDTADDTTGILEISVKNLRTGVTLTGPPPVAPPGTYPDILSIEGTLTWRPRNRRASSELLRETAMIFKVP